jgi:hypothetical protein
MKPTINEIIGKRIVGVIVKESDRWPKSQLFLLFDDNTYFELYSTYDEIRGAGDIDKGGQAEIKELGKGSHKIVLEFHDDPLQ